jgi:hypothetical protein
VQDASVAFDDLAAEILALDRADLPCMTRLLFAGPATADELATVLRARHGAETGFGTQSRLTTTFRVRTGFTPAAYRRSQSATYYSI